jgi:hypothetical protein
MGVNQEWQLIYLPLACIVRIPEAAFRDPDRFSCGSRYLVDVTNGRHNQQLSRGHVIESTEESESQTISSRKANRSSEEVTWNFRCRDASDRSSQPHSAPTGVAAQQSENFQRFYRAVVSPTHVRVTAGGRIVPNTRTSAPPPFDWNGEKFHFEPRKAEGEQEQYNLQPVPWLHHAPPPGFPQLIPGGFLPHLNLLPRGNSIAMATMAPQLPPGPLTPNSQLQPINGDNAAASAQTSALPQQIKISPPTQFDQTKPFMYNGHLVYPVPPGFQPPPSAFLASMPMFGNAGFLPQNPVTPPTGFYPPQFPGAFAGMANPFMFPPGQQLPMGMTNGMQSSETAPSLAPYIAFLPPMVSITELLKSQIQLLQGNLKQMEHQMANNKHQIDEAIMEHQRGLIVSQISSLEVMLETHLVQEGAMVATRGNENQSGLGISISSSKENTVPSLVSNNPTIAQSSKGTAVSTGAQGRSTKPTDDAETTQVEQSNSDKKPAVRSESISKSRLTMAAAMAPPFQPRSQVAIAQASQGQLSSEISRSVVPSPMEDIPFETQAQIESRLLAKSSTNWGYSGFPNVAATANVTLSRTKSVQEPSTQGYHEAPPLVLQKFNTFHSQTTTAPMSPPSISPNAVPYLIGKIPNGVPAGQVKESDFVYPRQLTGDEIRARYLYWGKAPRSVQSGLPKFDGKDFYPPSPVKQNTRLASVTPSHSITATVPQLNFEELFDSPAKSPTQLLASGRVAQYGQAWVPSQQAEFGSPDHGYGSLSFRPGATGLSDWSTHNGRLDETPQQPHTPSRPISTQNLVIAPVTEDFSHLFLEPGVPGYKSPSPLHNNMSKFMVKFDKEPVTPKNPGSPGESESGFETGKVDSENQNITEYAENDASSTNSSVEFHLSPQNQTRSPRASREISFAERVENFRRQVKICQNTKPTLTDDFNSVEQQTLFLQNMLKNTDQTQMTSPALSGAISSATAQGYLPQYRGSAAASLAPAIVNFTTGERDGERTMAKADVTHDSATGVAPGHAANFLPENRPLSGNRLQRPTPSPTENMGAEEYMRYLTQKDELDKKLLEKQWNADESGTGPISGSDW